MTVCPSVMFVYRVCISVILYVCFYTVLSVWLSACLSLGTETED